jgi:hypothetical protein
MSERAKIAPEDCSEPYNHEVFRYCPVCTWTEAPPETQRLLDAIDRQDEAWWTTRFLMAICDQAQTWAPSDLTQPVLVSVSEAARICAAIVSPSPNTETRTQQ